MFNFKLRYKYNIYKQKQIDIQADVGQKDCKKCICLVKVRFCGWGARVRGLVCCDLGHVTSVIEAQLLTLRPKVLENIGGGGLNSSHLCPTNKILPT